MANRNRGDRTAQRRRRKARYRGCRICGLVGAQCTECDRAAALVAELGAASLVLVVDGSFMTKSGEREGDPKNGHGGAGLVLVRGGLAGTVVAQRWCQFRANGSHEAELQAVIRGARWAPGVRIFTDCESIVDVIRSSNPALDVHFLPDRHRHAAYEIAHQLSVAGRKLIAGAA